MVVGRKQIGEGTDTTATIAPVVLQVGELNYRDLDCRFPAVDLISLVDFSLENKVCLWLEIILLTSFYFLFSGIFGMVFS